MDRVQVVHKKPHRWMMSLALALAALAWAGGSLWSQMQTGPATKPAATQPARRYNPPAGSRVVEEGWFAPIKPGAPAPELPAEINRAFVLPIRGPITSATARAFERQVRMCRDKDAQIVILDLNTPGGSLAATEEIIKRLSEDLRGIRTVAYVNRDAFSAGAMIALACNEIVMMPQGKIGSISYFLAGPGGNVNIPARVRERIESAARSTLHRLAEMNGYDSLVCEAMAGSEMSIWLIRHQRRGELRFVRPHDWSALPGAPPVSTRPAPRQATLSEPGWEYVRTVDGPDDLLLATAKEAIFLGLARHAIPTMAGLRKQYNITADVTVLPSDDTPER